MAKVVIATLAAIAALLILPMALSTRGPQAQFPLGQIAGPENTCKCEPPIRSQATATGTCTRTQDDGTFCDLNFSLSQRYVAASASPEFDHYLARMNLSPLKERFGALVNGIETEEYVRYSPQVVSASLQAVTAVSAWPFAVHDEGRQTRLRDIIEILDLEKSQDQARNGAVIRSLKKFASQFETGSAQIESVSSADGHKFEIVTQPGCIAFNERPFTFMVRASGLAPPCEQGR